MLINALKGMTTGSSLYLVVTKLQIFSFRQHVMKVQFAISVVEQTNSGNNCVHEGNAGLENSKDC